MRRPITLALLALFVAGSLASGPAAAQQRRPGTGGQPDQQDDQDAARRRNRDAEWNQPTAPLPQMRNAGPCPYVKVLYDAGRFLEFKGARQSAGTVAWTGEIEGISAGCEYKDDEPIRVRLEMLFAMGRGPEAEGQTKTYRYWVAVTQRNQSVIAKEYFDLPVRFQPGQDRALIREQIEGIVIPRATMETSGGNFEVLIGFDVTPENAAFNRDGKRFRVNAGAPQPATAPTTP